MYADPGGAAYRASRADHASCRLAVRQGSLSFHAASLLLAPALRQRAHALYAFCRLADDAVDNADPRVPGAAATALDGLRERLEAVYAGRPYPQAADRALCETVLACGIPRTVFEALLDGLQWDAEGRQPLDLPGVHAYAARVAGTVGIMMSLIMGVRDAQVLARACDLGVAMQLTNIARDVGEDARSARLYLPRDWLAEAGIDAEAWLRRPRFCPALGAVVARLLAEAERLYRRAESGIVQLPAGCRPGIMAARFLYAEIGAQVQRNGLDSVAVRAVVPLGRKSLLAARAALAVVPGRAGARALAEPPLPAVRFLVDAAAARRAAPPAPLQPGRGGVLRVLDILERQARRERWPASLGR